MDCSSHYVAMPDGIELALDVWRAVQGPERARPVLLLCTRYWRALDLVDGDEARQGLHALAASFTAAGFVVVNVDARGSGASFGQRRTEWSDEEMADLYHVVEWLAQQPWCDGRVAAHGYSYGGNTSFLAAAAGHPALKVITPQFADIDLYAHNVALGGLVNGWLRDAWGRFTAALDSADVPAVAACLPGVDAAAFCAAVRGPRPVPGHGGDDGRARLRQAVAAHAGNFNFARAVPDDYCLDDPVPGEHRLFDAAALGIKGRRAAVQAAGTPVCYWAGWSDAGTAAGALELFRDFSNPMQVVIGPWNHGRRHWQDPLGPEWPEPLPLADNFADVQRAIHTVFDAQAGALRPAGPVLDYYTLGCKRWQRTEVWPLPQTTLQRWFLQAGATLQAQPAAQASTCSQRVDPAASTGVHNRWHTQIGCQPVRHEDRRAADARLMVFDSAPLAAATEITGTPVAHLHLASDRPDAALFVYLEALLPSGEVRLLTEGCLRLAHRHGGGDFSRRALRTMPAGRFEPVVLPLLPLSIELPAGVALRVALAGADAHTFVAPVPDTPATFTVHLGGEQASHIELPVIPLSTQNR